MRLYYASEPSDYKGLEDKTYQDIHELAARYADYEPGIVTRETSDPEWIDFLSTKGGSSQMSMWNFGKDKVAEIKSRTGGTKIRSKGKNDMHISGVGVSRRQIKEGEGRDDDSGIGFFDGVLMTPRGLYNIVQIAVSDEFPQGQAVVPIQELSRSEIRVGESLKDILQDSVVEYWAGAGPGIGQSRTINSCFILCKDGRYSVEFDDFGKVTEVKSKFPVPQIEDNG